MAFANDFTMTIAGQGVASPNRFAVENPATGQDIGFAPDCSADQLDDAVAAARSAFAAWAATPIEERKTLLRAFGDSIFDAGEELAALLTAEQGKPRLLADGEILGARGIARALTALDLPVERIDDGSGKLIETHHVPLGVVAAIAPWNVPIVLAMAKVVPALLAGNAVLLKPSPFTPLTALRLGEIGRAIFPPGVFNVVSGSDRLGPWLTAHRGIDKVSFTGSSATGRRVMESAAANLKRVTLELGGNDACIVMPDVDVEKVAEKLFWMAFRNGGQVCVATKRMYIHADIYDRLRDAIVAYGRTVTVGDGAMEGTRIGPVNNRAQHDRVLALIADSRAQGHRFLLGGEPHDGPGYFVPVTIIDNPPEDSRIVQEEQFGPVLPLLKFDAIDDVVDRANAVDYGLGGSVWSADVDAALAIARRLQTGNVWINDVQHISPLAAFGGHKQSGIGAENGLTGLLEYTQTQTIVRPAVA